MEGHKLDNILLCSDKVSFCVVGKAETIPETFSVKYESVVLFGRVSEVEGDEKQKALLALIKKYSSAYLEKGQKYVSNDKDITRVFKLSIEWITGKKGR